MLDVFGKRPAAVYFDGWRRGRDEVDRIEPRCAMGAIWIVKGII
jgi:hypothetical protein